RDHFGRKPRLPLRLTAACHAERRAVASDAFVCHQAVSGVRSKRSMVMADASGIGFVSQSLQALLRSVITDSGPFMGTGIELRSPKELRLLGNNQTVVSLWLYRVTRLEDLVNAPPVRLD